MRPSWYHACNWTHIGIHVYMRIYIHVLWIYLFILFIIFYSFFIIFDSPCRMPLPKPLVGGSNKIRKRQWSGWELHPMVMYIQRGPTLCHTWEHVVHFCVLSHEIMVPKQREMQRVYCFLPLPVTLPKWFWATRPCLSLFEPWLHDSGNCVECCTEKNAIQLCLNVTSYSISITSCCCMAWDISILTSTYTGKLPLATVT